MSLLQCAYIISKNHVAVRSKSLGKVGLNCKSIHTEDSGNGKKPIAQQSLECLVFLLGWVRLGL
jgi:hypothetical protein